MGSRPSILHLALLSCLLTVAQGALIPAEIYGIKLWTRSDSDSSHREQAAIPAKSGRKPAYNGTISQQGFLSRSASALGLRSTCENGVNQCEGYTCDKCGACCGSSNAADPCQLPFGQCCASGRSCDYGTVCWTQEICCPYNMDGCVKPNGDKACCQIGLTCSSGACIGVVATSVTYATVTATSRVTRTTTSTMTVTSPKSASSTVVVTSFSTSMQLTTYTSTSTITVTGQQNQARGGLFKDIYRQIFKPSLAARAVPSSTWYYTVWSWPTSLRAEITTTTILVGGLSVFTTTVFSTVTSQGSTTTTITATVTSVPSSKSSPRTDQTVIPSTRTEAPSTSSTSLVLIAQTTTLPPQTSTIIAQTTTLPGSTVTLPGEIITTSISGTLSTLSTLPGTIKTLTGAVTTVSGLVTIVPGIVQVGTVTSSVSAPTITPCSDCNPGLSTGAYAGIGAGSAVAVIGIIAALILFWRKRRAGKEPDFTPVAMPTPNQMYFAPNQTHFTPPVGAAGANELEHAPRSPVPAYEAKPPVDYKYRPLSSELESRSPEVRVTSPISEMESPTTVRYEVDGMGFQARPLDDYHHLGTSHGG